MNKLRDWKLELEKLSEFEFKETGDAIFDFYREALIDIRKIAKNNIEKYPHLTFSMKLEMDRIFQAGGEIKDILLKSNANVDEAAKEYLKKQGEFGYFGTMYNIDGITELGFAFIGIDKQLIELIIMEGIDESLYSQRLHKNITELVKKVQEEMLRASYTGASYEEIAKQIEAFVQSDYNRALRIIRTEGGRLNSKTTQQAYEDAREMGLEFNKKWVSVGDSRVRRNHQILHDQSVPVDDPFVNSDGKEAQYPRGFGIASEDINCRCTTVVDFPDVDKSLSVKYRKFRAEGGSYGEWLKELEKMGE